MTMNRISIIIIIVSGYCLSLYWPLKHVRLAEPDIDLDVYKERPEDDNTQLTR